MRVSCLLAVLVHVLVSFPTVAQSGIQWGGNATVAVDRAKDAGVPVMFWVTQTFERDDEAANDLRDAQLDSFCDPIVLALTERYFVPCRVARNSRVLAEAEKLGLPKNIGLHIALISPTGELLDQIDPGQVASPEALADRMTAASRKYRESDYAAKLKPVLADRAAPKAEVRKAVRAVWQRRMYSADQEVVGLLARPDLTAAERSRLYQLLAAFGTGPCVEALLDAAPKDEAAMSALRRAEPAALTTLLERLPENTGEVTARQIAAYRATAAITKRRDTKEDAFWVKATPEERTKELDRMRLVGQTVFEAWQGREGRWR